MMLEGLVLGAALILRFRSCNCYIIVLQRCTLYVMYVM